MVLLMRILVCGGRNYSDKEKLERTLDELHAETIITDVIHGAASGADNMAGVWARANRREDERYIREWRFPADWDGLGKAAGPIRNKQMIEAKPDLVIAFPGGKGTANMVKLARETNIEVREIV